MKLRSLSRYREGVEMAWTSGELDRRRAERLRELANVLGLNSSAAANIEREVMGDTIEESLERHEQAAREEEYRTAVEEAERRRPREPLAPPPPPDEEEERRRRTPPTRIHWEFIGYGKNVGTMQARRQQ
jgi:hypothetical protein